MRGEASLVSNAEQWMSAAPLLQEDVSQLHRLGDIPTYGGPTPPTDRASGLLRNPKDSLVMMARLCEYAHTKNDHMRTGWNSQRRTHLDFATDYGG